MVRSEAENCCELTKKNWIMRMRRKESVCGGFVIFPVSTVVVVVLVAGKI